MSRRSIISLFLFFILTATGCAQISTVVTPVEKYDSASAYLYGNYTMDGRGASGVAIEIQNVSDPAKAYTIKMRKDGLLVVTKIDPGKYIITRFLALSLGNEIQGVQDLYGQVYRVPFEVTAGQAYYLGDHTGALSATVAFPATLTMTWSVGKVTDSFAKSSQSLAEQYPQFREVPKVRAFKN